MGVETEVEGWAKAQQAKATNTATTSNGYRIEEIVTTGLWGIKAPKMGVRISWAEGRG